MNINTNIDKTAEIVERSISDIIPSKEAFFEGFKVWKTTNFLYGYRSDG